MGKKFMEGMALGGGFAVSFVVISWLAWFFVTPRAIKFVASDAASIPPHAVVNEESGPPFDELPVEEKIEKSSAIALARYQTAPDGHIKAILTEILKKDPGTTFYYKVGDEYPSASYYPSGDTRYGDGLVIFFAGSPAGMRESMSFSGDRIAGLGDMPLTILRDKCATAGRALPTAVR